MTWWSPDFSLHGGGWKAHFDRVRRWHDRLHAWDMETAFLDARFLDDIWAFFIACLSLRDWLNNDNAATDEELRQLFESSWELRVCRDVANGAKHFTLTRPSTERFSIGRQYKAAPFVVFEDSVVGERVCDVLTLADGCLNRWQDFLESKKLV